MISHNLYGVVKCFTLYRHRFRARFEFPAIANRFGVSIYEALILQVLLNFKWNLIKYVWEEKVQKVKYQIQKTCVRI